MTNADIINSIKDILGTKKELVGIKAWREEPQDIPQYEGKAFPGMCTQIGEVLKTGETFHTNLDHQFCTGGVVATGVAPRLSEEERNEMLKVHFKMSKGYKDIETAIKYLDVSEEMIPPVDTKNAAVQLGLFKDIETPDIVLIFCQPAAADILNRTYTYTVGEAVRGFGGNGGCPFALQFPYVTKKPSFTYSDVAWRKFIGLGEDELTLSFPYECLVSFIENLPIVAEEYRNYAEGMG
jgi:uncharacterized protein (DUF169 family)